MAISGYVSTELRNPAGPEPGWGEGIRLDGPITKSPIFESIDPGFRNDRPFGTSTALTFDRGYGERKMGQRRLLTWLALVTIPPFATAQELPTQKILPLALAQEAAFAAMSSCAAAGNRVSVVLVNADGIVRITIRGDRAGAHTINSAFRKAYTAATFGRPTSAWAETIAKNPEVGSMQHIDHILMAGGGLPIRAGVDLIGAIGAAGSPGFDKDEACAQVGIDKIKDRLR